MFSIFGRDCRRPIVDRRPPTITFIQFPITIALVYCHIRITIYALQFCAACERHPTNDAHTHTQMCVNLKSKIKRAEDGRHRVMLGCACRLHVYRIHVYLQLHIAITIVDTKFVFGMFFRAIRCLVSSMCMFSLLLVYFIEQEKKPIWCSVGFCMWVSSKWTSNGWMVK